MLMKLPNTCQIAISKVWHTEGIECSLDVWLASHRLPSPALSCVPLLLKPHLLPSDRDTCKYYKSLIYLLQVDVAVVEVGIGGGHDCTNVVRNPVVSGIAMLGLEHTTILGGTIQQIAWHKTGIMKVRTPVCLRCFK